MNKRAFLLVILLIVPMLLAACGGGAPDADEVEDAFRQAFNEGETGDLNDLLCEDEQFDDEEDTMPEGVSVSDVNCDIDDDSFSCNMTFNFEGEEPFETTFSGDIEDGKLCNFDTPSG